MAKRASNAELVARTCRGENEAFEELVHRYNASVVALAYAILGERETARDVTQEAFIEALRRIDGLREPSKFANWVCGIARRMCIYRLRAAGRNPEEPLHESTARTEHADGPAARAERREREEATLAALRGLPLTYREVMVLRYLKERSYLEIAEILDLSPAAVEKRLVRAKEMLREKLRGYA